MSAKSDIPEEYLEIVLDGLRSSATYEEIRESVREAGGEVSLNQLRNYADMYKTLRVMAEDNLGELTFRSRNGRVLKVKGAFEAFKDIKQRLDWLAWLEKQLAAEIESGGLWIVNKRTIRTQSYETDEEHRVFNGALVKNFLDTMDQINKLMGDYRGKVQVNHKIDVSPVLQALQRTYQKMETLPPPEDTSDGVEITLDSDNLTEHGRDYLPIEGCFDE